MFLAGPWSVLSVPPDGLAPATEEEGVGPEDVIEGTEGGMALPPPPPPLGGLLNSESVGGGGGPD